MRPALPWRRNGPLKGSCRARPRVLRHCPSTARREASLTLHVQVQFAPRSDPTPWTMAHRFSGKTRRPALCRSGSRTSGESFFARVRAKIIIMSEMLELPPQRLGLGNHDRHGADGALVEFFLALGGGHPFSRDVRMVVMSYLRRDTCCLCTLFFIDLELRHALVRAEIEGLPIPLRRPAFGFSLAFGHFHTAGGALAELSAQPALASFIRLSESRRSCPRPRFSHPPRAPRQSRFARSGAIPSRRFWARSNRCQDRHRPPFSSPNR